ncbi:MAG: polysaccharide deacetylase family protein [Alphaproteobacteria bacterium]
MAGWDDLEAELSAWRRGGAVATFWWRDDDAVRVTPEVERLLSLSSDSDVPLGLAVVPRDADPALARRLMPEERVFVLVHGFGHVNHAPPGEAADEYGPHRSPEVRLGELAKARGLLSSFPRTLPVLVPPWNRIDEDLIPRLPGIGLTALSAMGCREPSASATPVRRLNVHVDLLHWEEGRFLGEAPCLDQVLSHLVARRTGAADPLEPTGIMSHHGWHDEGCWGFLGELFRRTRIHGAARWLSPAEALS